MIRSAPARKGQTALSGRAPDAGSWVRRRRRFLVEDGEMIEALPTIPMAMRVIDGRGSYDPGPLAELVAAARDGWLGETIAVRASEPETVEEVLAWVSAAGHGVIGLYERHGYEEVIVEVRR
jgi:TusA-related sulfurtransferase